MARDGYVLISIIFYIAGIVCMTIPSISPLVLCITGGIILAAYGIVKIIGYLSDDLYDLAFQYDLACGIFLIVLGVIVLGCNLRIRSYLSPGLGLLILLDAVLKVQTAKDAKVFGLEIWKWILGCVDIKGMSGMSGSVSFCSICICWRYYNNFCTCSWSSYFSCQVDVGSL